MASMVLVGGRPEEKGDERTRTWEERGVVVGGADCEGKGNEAILDDERAAGLNHNELLQALMLLKLR